MRVHLWMKDIFPNCAWQWSNNLASRKNRTHQKNGNQTPVVRQCSTAQDMALYSVAQQYAAESTVKYGTKHIKSGACSTATMLMNKHTARVCRLLKTCRTSQKRVTLIKFYMLYCSKWYYRVLLYIVKSHVHGVQ